MIFNKKRSYFENKLTDSIGKLKDIWNALKSLGFPNRISSCEVCALKINNAVDKNITQLLLFFTPNIQSYRKRHALSDKYISEF